MSNVILVVNAGSSSIKFALYLASDLKLLARGQVTGLSSSVESTWEFILSDGEKHKAGIGAIDTHSAAIDFIVNWLKDHSNQWQLVAAGHRVVHGGKKYASPVRITPETLAELRQLQNLAPQHQSNNLAVIEGISDFIPELLQVACFDTAFHSTQPPEQRVLPIPKRYRDKGLMKYGFHGLSYEYLVKQLPTINAGHLPDKLIIAHLGNGASVCAINKGRSVATTMSFSTLDGLVMGSRCGTLDPGVLLHLLQEERVSVNELSHSLYSESGLLGLSGISSDVRQLEASSSEQAELALKVYIDTLAKQVAAFGSVLGGIDALVLSGGVGENSIFVRAQLLARLAWLGCELDEKANQQGQHCITKDSSPIRAFVLPTNEELIIAQHVLDIYLQPITPLK